VVDGQLEAVDTRQQAVAVAADMRRLVAAVVDMRRLVAAAVGMRQQAVVTRRQEVPYMRPVEDKLVAEFLGPVPEAEFMCLPVEVVRIHWQAVRVR
jgi:hypothetical protein